MKLPDVYRCDPFESIQTWWGEDLTPSLAARIAGAPEAQRNQFSMFVRSNVGAQVDALSTQLGLRPIVKMTPGDYLRGRSQLKFVDRSISLLLYVDDVLVEDPLRELDSNFVDASEVMQALLDLKPLADAGLIHFFSYSSRFRHPSRTHGFTAVPYEELEQQAGALDLLSEIQALADRHGVEFAKSLTFGARGSIGSSILIAQNETGPCNLLASNPEEAVLLPVGMRAAALSSTDTRRLQMSRLAALDLPRLNTSTVASIRASSEPFDEWRRAFGTALESIDGLRADDENWQREAKGIIASELAPVRQRLGAAVNRSPALTAAHSGMLGLTYSGIGAGVGSLIGGNPAVAAAGAAGVKGSEFVVNYLRGIRSRRHDRAVLDLALSITSD